MKKILLTFIMITGMMILAACSKTKDDTTTSDTTSSDITDSNTQETALKPTGEEFTIGILPAESAIPIILAKEKGFLNKKALLLISKPSHHRMIVM